MLKFEYKQIVDVKKRNKKDFLNLKRILESKCRYADRLKLDIAYGFYVFYPRMTLNITKYDGHYTIYEIDKKDASHNNPVTYPVIVDLMKEFMDEILC